MKLAPTLLHKSIAIVSMLMNILPLPSSIVSVVIWTRPRLIAYGDPFRFTISGNLRKLCEKHVHFLSRKYDTLLTLCVACQRSIAPLVGRKNNFSYKQ
jgi:hypothetical protein